MKNKYRLKILEFLEGGVQAAGEILFIFSLPYGTSYSRTEYLLEKRREEAEKDIFKQKTPIQVRRNFNDFVYRLRKDGLISDSKTNKNHFLKLTEKGRRLLEKLRSDKNELPPRMYKTKGDDLLKIIIFDIPEREKRKREWLRYALKNLNFKMLQKSVWAGKTKLPEDFLSDLRRFNIFSYIEIFAISRTGSLRQVKE